MLFLILLAVSTAVTAGPVPKPELWPRHVPFDMALAPWGEYIAVEPIPEAPAFPPTTPAVDEEKKEVDLPAIENQTPKIEDVEESRTAEIEEKEEKVETEEALPGEEIKIEQPKAETPVILNAPLNPYFVIDGRSLGGRSTLGSWISGWPIISSLPNLSNAPIISSLSNLSLPSWLGNWKPNLSNVPIISTLPNVNLPSVNLPNVLPNLDELPAVNLPTPAPSGARYVIYRV